MTEEEQRQIELQNGFTIALQKDNIVAVKDIFKSSFDFELYKEHTAHPAIWAARYGSLEVMKYLISKSESIFDCNRWNARLIATKYGHDKIISYLDENELLT